MTKKLTAIEQCILWNKNRAKKATDPKDKARYLDNIKNLEAFRDAK